jgi:sarcosine oxidase
MDGIRETYRAAGVPYEELERDEIQRRFPQFSLPDDTIGLYQADYSLLVADRCVATLAAGARVHGASILEGETVSAITPNGSGIELLTTSGMIRADRVILATGSWIAPQLRDLGIDLPITVLKEQLAFFAARNPEAYAPGRLPLVIHRFPGTTTLGSFFPFYRHDGVKIMIDRIGPAVDPADADRSIDSASLARLRDYAMQMMPGLTGDVLDAVSCRYTMTPDEDFVIDSHPEIPEIVIASTCSGHGFKFAVAIGRILADLAITGRSEFDIARFRLDRPALRAAAY